MENIVKKQFQDDLEVKSNFLESNGRKIQDKIQYAECERRKTRCLINLLTIN